MATPIKDMEAAFWTFLGRQPAYSALGLREYRTYDGNMLPFDPTDGVFPEADLPAIALELRSFNKAVTGEGDQDPGGSPLGYKLIAECEGSIVYQGPERDGVEHATDTIRRALDSRTAHMTTIGAADVIEHYVIDFGDLRPWSPLKGNRGTITFWQQEFTLTLQTHRTRIN
jgi:hypothetical protein